MSDYIYTNNNTIKNDIIPSLSSTEISIKEISKFLKKTGFKETLLGYDYLVSAIKFYIDNECDNELLGKTTYEYLEKLFLKKAKTIEKNITTSIETAFLNCDIDYVYDKLFMFGKNGKMTNNEFIAEATIRLLYFSI